MNIKIQCQCGTKFAFDVEPMNGRMPVDVHCPSCNASALAQANEEIRRQLGASAPAPAPAPARPAPTATATVLTPPPSPSGPAPTPVAPAPAPAPAARVHVSLPPRPASAGAPAPAPEQAAAPAPASLVPQPPRSTALRISGGSAHAAAPAPAAAAAAAGPGSTAPAQLCPRHPSEHVVEKCRVCGKPICPKCMEQFGYVCSVYCRNQAEAKHIQLPVYANQRRVVQQKESGKARQIAWAVTALVVLLLGVWVWYIWFARNPKVIYSVSFPKPSDSALVSIREPNDYYELIGPNELLSIKDKRLTLLNVQPEKQLWTAQLQSEAESAAVKAARAKNDALEKQMETNPNLNAQFDPLGFEGDYEYSNPRVITTSNDVWLVLRTKLLRFDHQNGSPKDPGVTNKIVNVTEGTGTLLVVSDEPSGREVLTQITLADGGTQSEEISPAKAKPAARPAARPPAAPAVVAGQNPNARPGMKVPRTGEADSANHVPAQKIRAAATQAAEASQAANTAAAATDEEGDPMASYFRERDPGFIPAGPNVVQFTKKELEHKVIVHEAMKAKTKSIMDSGHLTAGQSLDATQEMLNDMRRDATGGKEEEDVSRYQVTLHRRMATGIADWTGEVAGPPAFIPLKTVDVVTADNSITVFDKNNKKLWDAKVTYEIPHMSRYGRYDSEDSEDSSSGPCLESKDALYVADKGMLTCFELGSGAARWRLNSVGISRIQEDARGKIYLDTTTAGPDSIKYSQQINIYDKPHPLILKVDPATGKILWRLQSHGDAVQLSGKFVYTSMVSQTMAWLKLEEGPDTHYNIYLINPSNGSEIWDYYQANHSVRSTQIQKNWILVRFDDELVVMKFFSL